MKTSRRIIPGLIVVIAVAALAGCPSPLLTTIKGEIAKAPFTGTGYGFLRQFGNPTPQYSFTPTMVVRADVAGFIYVADGSSRLRKFDGSGNLVASYSLKANAVFGNIYDMTFDNAGNLFVLNPNPSLEVDQYDLNGNFVKTWTVSVAIYEIAVDGTYLYGVGSSAVYKFDYSGNLLNTWNSTANFGGTALSSANGIATDGSYLYILDSGNLRVVKIDTAGNYSTSWTGSGSGTAFSGPQGIAVAYGVVYVVDTGHTRVVGFNTSGTYQSTASFGTSGTSNGSFTSPNSAAVDNAGAIYVSDQGAYVNQTWRVQKFSGAPPSFVASWAETSASAGNGDFSYPSALAQDSLGNIYVADGLYSRVEKFNSTGGFITQWGAPDNGTHASGMFSTGIFAWGMAADATHNRVYVPDDGNNRIQVFTTSGSFINYLASSGSGNGQVSSPMSVALDSAGNVYVCDEGNYRIEVFGPTGLYLRQWGSNGTGNGQFVTPVGVAVDGNGNVYVSDFFGNRVQKFDSQGHYISSVGTYNTYGSGNGQFDILGGIAVDQIGNVYVVDLGNRRVQKFDPNLNFMGALGGVGSGNGAFGLPLGVAVTPSGQVAVTDYYSGIVEEFQPTF